MMTMGGRLFQASSVFVLSLLSFITSLPNHRLWDDEKILGTRLAVESAPNVFQLWREPYWSGQVGSYGSSKGKIPSKQGYRPLGLTLLYAERCVFGEWMPGFHLVSLLLHGLVGLALLRVLWRITNEPVAWLAAMLFAVHPVHAEAVAMAYGQLELLAALFALLAIDLYLVPGANAGRLGVSLSLAFLSACSKESGLMLPAVLVLLRGFYLRPRDPWVTRWFTWREALFALPGIAYLAARYAAMGTVLETPATTITYGYSRALHVKTVIVSLGNAIRLALFPTGQTLYYGHLRDHLLNVPWSEMAWIGVGAVICGILARMIGKKAVIFGLGWFLIALFPVLNIVPCGVLVGERNLYLPAAAVVFLAACLWNRLGRTRTATAMAGVLVLFCAVDSNLVARQWRDGETLWRSTVNNHPNSPMAFAALGGVLLEQTGREDEAEQCFRRALELNPNVTGGKHGMAIIDMRRGDYQHALGWLAAQESGDEISLDAEIKECRSRMSATQLISTPNLPIRAGDDFLAIRPPSATNPTHQQSPQSSPAQNPPADCSRK